MRFTQENKKLNNNDSNKKTNPRAQRINQNQATNSAPNSEQEHQRFMPSINILRTLKKKKSKNETCDFM